MSRPKAVGEQEVVPTFSCAVEQSNPVKTRFGRNLTISPDFWSVRWSLTARSEATEPIKCDSVATANGFGRKLVELTDKRKLTLVTISLKVTVNRNGAATKWQELDSELIEWDQWKGGTKRFE